MSNIRKIDYTSAEGLPQRSLIPDDASGIDPSEGIPLHLDLDPLYGHLPLEFRQRLYQAIWAHGLVEPCDYLQPGAAEKFMAALRSIVKRDALDAAKLAKEVCKHER
jgi:hypothetical protein